MELNQTSPPLSSSLMDTEGDDSCGINVTDVAVNGVTLLICLCGLAGNGAVLWLLGFHIRRNPITVYILNLAVADFTFLLFMVPSSLLYLLDDVSCSTVVSLKYLRSLLLLSLLSYNMGLYLLTAISIERCGSILFPLWYRCRRPRRLSWVVCALLWALSIAVMVMVTSLCLSHEHEHCRVALISMYALSFLIFAPPMVISNVILFIKVQCGSKRPAREALCPAPAAPVISFPFLTADFGHWLLLRAFDFSVFAPSPPLLLTCAQSSALPLTDSLAGSCAKEFAPSGSAALQRAFVAFVPEPGHRDNTVEPSSSGIIMKERHHNPEP
uniref:G-protein coupled receptors family 1 profile domain-containing protein n=1 Tax=Zonotrichia albicollis TaxID=44394 RepID=A0A8D2MEA7_ZONAL